MLFRTGRPRVPCIQITPVDSLTYLTPPLQAVPNSADRASSAYFSIPLYSLLLDFRYDVASAADRAFDFDKFSISITKLDRIGKIQSLEIQVSFLSWYCDCILLSVVDHLSMTLFRLKRREVRDNECLFTRY